MRIVYATKGTRRDRLSPHQRAEACRARYGVTWHNPLLAEFAFTVLIGGALGGFILYKEIASAGHPRSPFILQFGVYMLLIGLNYTPPLLYTIGIARRGNVRQVVAHELVRKDYYVGKYSLQKLLLPLPLVIPTLALLQEIRRPAQRQSQRVRW